MIGLSELLLETSFEVELMETGLKPRLKREELFLETSFEVELMETVFAHFVKLVSIA